MDRTFKHSFTTTLPGAQAGARGRRREHDGMGAPPPHAALGAAAAQQSGAVTHGRGRQHVAAGTPLGGLERAGENPCKALGVQGSHTEVQMEHLEKVGPALVDLYHKPGKDWKLNQKWVYTGLQVTSGFFGMSREKTPP